MFPTSPCNPGPLRMRYSTIMCGLWLITGLSSFDYEFIADVLSHKSEHDARRWVSDNRAVWPLQLFGTTGCGEKEYQHSYQSVGVAKDVTLFLSRQHTPMLFLSLENEDHCALLGQLGRNCLDCSNSVDTVLQRHVDRSSIWADRLNVNGRICSEMNQYLRYGNWHLVERY